MRRLSIALVVLRDMSRMSPMGVLAIGPLGLLTAVSRLLGAGLLLQFIGGYAKGAGGPGFDILGIDLGIEANASRAWFWVAVIAVAAIIGTALDYANVYAQLHIGRKFADHVGVQELEALRDNPHRFAQTMDPSGFVRGSGAILGSITPALQAIVFGVVMFVMRPGLSAVLFVLGLVFLGPLTIFLGDRILGASLRKQAAPNRAGSDPNMALLSSGPLYADVIRLEAYSETLADASRRERYESIFQIRTNQQLARAAATAFTGIGAVVLAVGLTVAENPGANDVGSLLAYAIVAQYTFRSVAQIGTNAVAFNRYLPTYESYVAMKRSDVLAVDAAIDPVHSGEVWLVRQRKTPEAAIVRTWLAALGVDPATRCAVALLPDELPDRGVLEMMMGGRPFDPEAVDRCQSFFEDVLGESLGFRELEGTVADLRADDAKLAAIALCPVVLQPEPLLLVCPVKLLAKLDNNRRDAAVDHLARHHVIVVGRGRDNLLQNVDREIDGEALDLPSSVLFDDDEDDVA